MQVCYWYLRLISCLAINNMLVYLMCLDNPIYLGAHGIQIMHLFRFLYQNNRFWGGNLNVFGHHTHWVYKKHIYFFCVPGAQCLWFYCSDILKSSKYPKYRNSFMVTYKILVKFYHLFAQNCLHYTPKIYRVHFKIIVKILYF